MALTAIVIGKSTTIEDQNLGKLDFKAGDLVTDPNTIALAQFHKVPFSLPYSITVRERGYINSPNNAIFQFAPDDIVTDPLQVALVMLASTLKFDVNSNVYSS